MINDNKRFMFGLFSLDGRDNMEILFDVSVEMTEECKENVREHLHEAVDNWIDNEVAVWGRRRGRNTNTVDLGLPPFPKSAVILDLYKKTKPRMTRREIAEELGIPFEVACEALCDTAQEQIAKKKVKAVYVCICKK